MGPASVRSCRPSAKDRSLILQALVAEGVSIPASSLAQPIVFDAQGDMKVDLLGVPKSATSLQIWQNGAVLNQTTPFTM